jgi:hypothetical protein
MYASYTHMGYLGGRPGTVGACQRHHWRVPYGGIVWRVWEGGGGGGWREGVGGWGVCTPMDVRVTSKTDVSRLRRYVPS